MTFLRAVLIGFVALESTNVLALYFFPDTWYANSVGVFKAWERSKNDSRTQDLVKYLVNWVAGTKLIFISLLVVLLLIAEDRVLVAAAAATVIAIASFYWRLFPLARKMDAEGEMEPRGYSRVLGLMIAVFVLLFGVGIALALAELA